MMLSATKIKHKYVVIILIMAQLLGMVTSNERKGNLEPI